MKLQDAFGQVLKEIRQERRLSQEKLALECGLDRTFVSLLERGQRQPTLSSLFALAGALNVTASELVRRVESLAPEGK